MPKTVSNNYFHNKPNLKISTIIIKNIFSLSQYSFFVNIQKMAIANNKTLPFKNYLLQRQMLTNYIIYVSIEFKIIILFYYYEVGPKEIRRTSKKRKK